jgi:hypothetical protein
LLAIAGTVVGLFSLFMAVNTNVSATHSLIDNVSSRASRAASEEAKRAQDDAKDLRAQIEAADVRSADKLQQIQAQLDTAGAQIEMLKVEVQRLTGQGKTSPRTRSRQH